MKYLNVIQCFFRGGFPIEMAHRSAVSFQYPGTMVFCTRIGAAAIIDTIRKDILRMAFSLLLFCHDGTIIGIPWGLALDALPHKIGITPGSICIESDPIQIKICPRMALSEIWSPTLFCSRFNAGGIQQQRQAIGIAGTDAPLQHQCAIRRLIIRIVFVGYCGHQVIV